MDVEVAQHREDPRPWPSGSPRGISVPFVGNYTALVTGQLDVVDVHDCGNTFITSEIFNQLDSSNHQNRVHHLKAVIRATCSPIRERRHPRR